MARCGRASAHAAPTLASEMQGVVDAFRLLDFLRRREPLE